MIARLTLFAFLLIVLTGSALAQAAGGVSGAVVDPEGRPIKGAAIEVLGSKPKMGSYSRADGAYGIRRLVPGTYRLLVSARRFEPDTVEVTVVGAAMATLGITLRPVPVVTDSESLEGIRRERALGYRGARLGGDGDVEALSAPAMVADEGRHGPMLAMKMAPAGAGDAAVERTAATASERPGHGTIDTQAVAPRPGQLTAAEWNDLWNWTFWQGVVAADDWKDMVPHWGYDPSTRVSLIVTDGERLIADAEVVLKEGQGGVVWRAKTDNRGRAELFAGVAGKAGGGYRIEVRSGEAFGALDNVAAPSNGQLIMKLRNPAPTPQQLDLMFVIDCTGSMGDELEYIKSELESVVDRVREKMPAELPLRMSANFYRDQGDEYVVRSFPFTESTFEAIGWIRDQRAENGGDFEEAVEEALDDAINKHEWSASARARLLFLVLDAPPHYTPERVAKLHELTRAAAARGIRIIPVASSGINKETEFLLRLFGIYTGGTYTFLTDDSGIGNSHLQATVGEHRIEYLDDLIVRLIGDWTSEGVISEELRARLR